MHYLSEFVQSATIDVYQSMVGLTVEPIDGDETASLAVEPEGVTVSVRFSGAFEGVLHMTYDESLAKNVTFTMMGEMPPSLSDPGIGDVLGELANMIGGNLKGKLAGKGLSCQNLPPQIVANRDFAPASIPGGVSLTNRMRVPVSNADLQVRLLAKF